MRGVIRGVFAAALAAFATAQDPDLVAAPWQWVEVPASDAVAFAVLWPRGLDGDADVEHGATKVLAECRLARARAAVPEASASGIQVHGDAAIAFVLVDADAWRVGLRFVEALVDDTMSLDDDRIAQATSRVALAADDAAWLFPGPALECMARRALLTGPAARPIAGSLPALQALQPARVRELLRAPGSVGFCAAGAVTAELRAAVAAWQAPPGVGLTALTAVPSSVHAALARGADATAEHPRLDGPLVEAAFVVDGVDRAALAVAIEVARQRAARSLRLRGREAMARAPVVAWSWLHGEPLVQFRRRGADGGTADGPRRELEDLLADLHARPPSASELTAAVGTLCRELSPAEGAAVRESLPGRAMAALLLLHRGADCESLRAVTAEAAHGVFRSVCGPDRAWWGALLPAAGAAARPAGW